MQPRKAVDALRAMWRSATTVRIGCRAAALAVATCFAAGGVPAWAAQRYASPTGAGVGCTAPGTIPGPCGFVTAVSEASAKDDVIVEPGDYGSLASPMTTAAISSVANLTVQAAAGTRPRIFMAPTKSPNQALGLFEPGDSVSGLDLELVGGTTTQALFASHADRMIVHTSLAFSSACVLSSSAEVITLTNSLCWADHSGSNAVDSSAGGPQTIAVTLSNVTAEATGGGASNGMLVQTAAGSKITVTASNVIAHGSPSANSGDLTAETETNNATSKIIAGYSNYASIATTGAGSNSVTPVGSSTDQAAAPVFLNASTGNFREAAGSPTINAGLAAGTVGSLDLEGYPRIVGAAPDIGAYEQQILTASASATPSTVGVGSAATFTAVGVASIPDDPLTYTWHFDDGTSASGATVAHAFSSVGSHSGTVTISDTTGLSAAASASVTATLAAPSIRPTVTGAAQSHPRWREGHRLASFAKHRQHRAPIGTTFSFALNETASVNFAFKQATSGRMSGRKCAPQTNSNRHKRSCKRTLLRGELTFTGHGGVNKVSFQGRISHSKKLAPGRYTVTITALNAVGPSTPRRLSFAIVR